MAGVTVPPEHTQGADAPRAPRANFARGRGGGASRADRGRGVPSRGRGRGSGARQNKPTRNHLQQTQPQNLSTANRTSLSEQTLAGQKHEGQDVGEDTEDLDADLCFICASPVVHHSIAPCNHRTCHICALRLRALYKTKACAHCRAHAEFVIFSDRPDQRFEDYVVEDIAKTDDNLGIKYEKTEIFEDTVLLLRYNCPDLSCDMACFGWPDLTRHVKSVHHKVMCDLCIRNKKVFTHEHELFTADSLRRHMRYGDDNPGVANQSGFKGHPECGFCRERFYGDDELYTHCRDRHERCHICDRRQTSSGQHFQQQYYLDYNELEVHFGREHFMCPDAECLEKKFVVFESEMDLKAHQLEVHPNGLSKDARRDARRVDMSGFDYRSPRQEEQRRGGTRNREGRGRGRGRDPNVDEALPLSSAQPMRRDELAYQRQLAIHSAQSVSTRTFGGQLTSNDTYTARPPPSAQDPATITAPRPSTTTTTTTNNNNDNTTPPSNLDSLSLGPPTDPAHHDPRDQSRHLRHASILTRANHLTSSNPEKLTNFRKLVSSYNNSALTATALLDALFSLFDPHPPHETGTLVKELADAFEIPLKRDALLRAWNDWRAIHEDYPSLPGATAPNAGGSLGGKRVLRLKSATAQNSRSWGNAVNSGASASPARGKAGSRNADPFPTLPSGASRSNGVPSRAWVPSTPAPASAPQHASPAPSRPASRPAPARGPMSGAVADFPALPAAQKPGMNVGRNPVRRHGGVGSGGRGTPVNAWVDGGGLGNVPVVEDGDFEGAEGKKRGKKKQTLIHWG